MALYDPSQPVIQKKKWSVNIIDVIKSKKVDNAFHPCRLYKTSTPANGIWETGERIQHKHTKFKPFELLFPDEKYVGVIGNQVKFDRDVGSMSINGKKIFDSVYVVERYITVISRDNLDAELYQSSDFTLPMEVSVPGVSLIGGKGPGQFSQKELAYDNSRMRYPYQNHGVLWNGDLRVKRTQIPIAAASRTMLINSDAPQISESVKRYLNGGEALPTDHTKWANKVVWNVNPTSLEGEELKSYDRDSFPEIIKSDNYTVDAKEISKSTTLENFAWRQGYYVPSCLGCEGLAKTVGANTLTLKGSIKLGEREPIYLEFKHDLLMPDGTPKCHSIVEDESTILTYSGITSFISEVRLIVTPEEMNPDYDFDSEDPDKLLWAIEWACEECRQGSDFKNSNVGNNPIIEYATGLLWLVTSDGNKTTPQQIINPWWPPGLSTPRGTTGPAIFYVWDQIRKKVQWTRDGQEDDKFVADNHRPPWQTWHTGQGDCEDMAILMVSMLRYLGIECRLVLGKRPCAGLDFSELGGDGHAWVQIKASDMPGFTAGPPDPDGWINVDPTEPAGNSSEDASSGPQPCFYEPEYATDGLSVSKFINNKWESVPAFLVRPYRSQKYRKTLVITLRVRGTVIAGSFSKTFKLPVQNDVRDAEWMHASPTSGYAYTHKKLVESEGLRFEYQGDDIFSRVVPMPGTTYFENEPLYTTINMDFVEVLDKWDKWGKEP